MNDKYAQESHCDSYEDFLWSSRATFRKSSEGPKVWVLSSVVCLAYKNQPAVLLSYEK